MISYGLLDILEQHVGQASFHIASEKAVRIEFMRFSKGQQLGPLKYAGDVVVTCLNGTFEFGEDVTPATILTQVVVPEGEGLKIHCVSDVGAVQLIWAPPFMQNSLGAREFLNSP